LLAIFLLQDIILGLSATLILAGMYAVFAAIFYFGLALLYRARNRFGFFVRALISFKKNDGVFGIVSVTSLYIAITSLATLILLQSSLIQFLERDLGQTLPGLYVIDIQKSQTSQIQSEYPELNLFPNVGARILEIDGREILGSLARGEEETSGELGREYNLTYRDELLSTETIIAGRWLSGIPNEVSVEESFAERVGIKLGSRITLSIQGFTLESTVTSIRTSDRRSGLPFFFFVFNPQDLEKYPATFFGYGYYEEQKKNELITYIGKNFPNVSVIDTEGIAKFVGDVIRILTLIVLVIFIPPVFLAALLIMTLIVTAFKNRKKTSAQLRVLGATNTYTQKLYYAEMVAASAVSVVLGYITSTLVTYIVSTYYLKLDSIVWITYELLVVILGIGILVIMVAYTLWRSDSRSIREILSYEENS
jgi:putative ABC transport system permease protein